MPVNNKRLQQDGRFRQDRSIFSRRYRQLEGRRRIIAEVFEDLATESVVELEVTRPSLISIPRSGSSQIWGQVMKSSGMKRGRMKGQCKIVPFLYIPLNMFTIYSPGYPAWYQQ